MRCRISIAAEDFILAKLQTHSRKKVGRRHLQAFVDPELKPEYRTVRSTLRDAVAKNGVMSLWSGFAPRAVRVVGAAFILNGCRTKLEEIVLDFKAKDAKSA